MVAQTQSQEEAVRCFEMYCRAKGLAESTVKMYSFALDRLGRYLSDEAKGPSIPSRGDLRAFVAYMLGSGLGRQTIRTRMRAVRTFCGFLGREGLVAENPMIGVEIPRVPSTMPEVLSAEEIQKLPRASKTRSWYGVRNYAMLAVFLDTGLRLGELISLDVSDVDVGSAVIRVRNGKGSRERRVYAGRGLARALRDWIEVRPDTQADAALFTTRDGRGLDKRNVARIAERPALRAGPGENRVHPHMLRHTFATAWIINGGDVFSLQRMLGHASVSTTQVHVNLAGADLAMAHAKASPLDRLAR